MHLDLGVSPKTESSPGVFTVFIFEVSQKEIIFVLVLFLSTAL